MPNQKTSEYVRQLLKDCKLKYTNTRASILNALILNHGPFTIDEIHKLVGQKKCDLVTVYRTLSSLEKGSLVQKCHLGDDTVRYEFNDPSHHHHHIVCKKCKKLEELKLCPFEFLDQEVIKRGYTKVTHLVSFLGICPACQ